MDDKETRRHALILLPAGGSLNLQDFVAQVGPGLAKIVTEAIAEVREHGDRDLASAASWACLDMRAIMEAAADAREGPVEFVRCDDAEPLEILKLLALEPDGGASTPERDAARVALVERAEEMLRADEEAA